MAPSTINSRLVQVALVDVEPAGFERFGQAFFGALSGKAFVPLGGVKDGGGDGFFEPELFEDAKAVHFLQISKQGNYEKKIRDTVARLRKFGRSPAALTLLSSEPVAHIDRVEETLSEELNCRITVRDAKYIESHINDNDGTSAAFHTYLAPSISYLENPGATRSAPTAGLHTDRTLAVFLRQEVEHRQGKVDLLESVADSLIIWALSDTDPDADKFLNRDEILERIEAILPSAKQFIRGVLDARLLELRSRRSGEDRQVRYYTAGGLYCLPFETREIVKRENVEDTALKLDVSEILERRCEAVCSSNEKVLIPAVVRLCHVALERVFERQGLQVAQFAHGGEESDELYENVGEIVAAIIGEEAELDERIAVRRLVMAVYEATAEMQEGVLEGEVLELAEKIKKAKEDIRRGHDKEDILAYNDALQVHRIYARRQAKGESSPANPFGFKTWWLTQDANVRRAAAQLIGKHHGQRFMMRPEFLLNFISFAPSARDVVASYRNLFPTVLGVRLSNRLQSHTFREVMEKANSVWGAEPARASSMITDCVNALKGDTVKIYEHKWTSPI